MASPRPRLVCSRTGIEPDNDDTDTAATISIDGLFHLSVDQVGSNMNAPFASTVAAEMAVRFDKLFGNGPNFWINLQRAYDLAIAEQSMTRPDSTRSAR